MERKIFGFIATINLLSLKRRIDWDFKNNFLLIKKGEINTFKTFPSEAFPCKISLCQINRQEDRGVETYVEG